MKIYKGDKPGKSWSIQLTDATGTPTIQAVDSYTGRIIANLIIFSANGDVVALMSAKNMFELEGYDPYEHNNLFNDRGAIVIN